MRHPKVWPAPTDNGRVAGHGALTSPLGDADIELLAQALPNCSNLRSLDLRANAFSAATGRRLVRVIEANAIAADEGATAAEQRAEAHQRALEEQIQAEANMAKDPGAWVQVHSWNPTVADDGSPKRYRPVFKEKKKSKKQKVKEAEAAAAKSVKVAESVEARQRGVGAVRQ